MTNSRLCGAGRPPELASDELKPGIPESVGDVIRGSVNEIIDSMEFHGHLQVRVVMADDGREIRNGSSRSGFCLRRDMNGNLAIAAQVEWQVNVAHLGDGIEIQSDDDPWGHHRRRAHPP